MANEQVRRIDRSSMIDRMKEALQVRPERTAVITIDCQRGNLDPSMASLPVPEEECRRVIQGTNALLALARRTNIPIVHVWTVWEDVLLGAHPFERAMAETKQSFTPHKQSDFSRHKLPGSVEGELIPELDVRPEDYQVGGKRTFDMFYETHLATLLRGLGRDTLLIAGCNTNTCVLGSTFGAYSRNFSVVLVSDCVASAYGEDLHQFALSNVQRRLGWVLTLRELEEKLGAPAAAASGT